MAHLLPPCSIPFNNGALSTLGQGTNGSATAEAQMEPSKAPCSASSCCRWLGCKASGGATIILPPLIRKSAASFGTGFANFLYGTIVSAYFVQDFAFSCTEPLILSAHSGFFSRFSPNGRKINNFLAAKGCPPGGDAHFCKKT